MRQVKPLLRAVKSGFGVKICRAGVYSKPMIVVDVLIVLSLLLHFLQLRDTKTREVAAREAEQVDIEAPLESQKV